MFVFQACIFMYMIVLSGIGGQNGASDSLELQLQMIWMSFGTVN